MRHEICSRYSALFLQVIYFCLSCAIALGLSCYFASFNYIDAMISTCFLPFVITGVLLLSYIANTALDALRGKNVVEASVKRTQLYVGLFLILTFLVLVGTSTTVTSISDSACSTTTHFTRAPRRGSTPARAARALHRGSTTARYG